MFLQLPIEAHSFPAKVEYMAHTDGVANKSRLIAKLTVVLSARHAEIVGDGEADGERSRSDETGTVQERLWPRGLSSLDERCDVFDAVLRLVVYSSCVLS